MESTQDLTVDQLINTENQFIEEKYVKAYYSEALQIVAIVWDGMFTKDQYIDLFERLLSFAQDNKVKGFYSDIRKQGVVSIDARKHFEKNISPRGAKLGIQKTGVVSDASPFKKYYLNTLIKMTGRPTKICSKPEDALKYILE
jgi:hypothetical protein